MPDKPPAWVITAQTQTTDLGPAGAYVDGVKVTFTTASGAYGAVFVPHAEYTVERVRQLVSERATVMEGVAALQG